MDEHASTLGALLRDARDRLARRSGARVRQADVAERADITVEWYARIERGSVLPSFEVLSRIATALCLSSGERVEALRFVVPDLLRRDDAEPAAELTGLATRELRAYRRFHRRADSASTPHELIDMAVTTVMDGLPGVAFASYMSKIATNDRWLHRSVVRPDVAEAINQSAPLDDRVIQKSQLEQDGLRFVGSSDYGAASIAHLRDRNTHTELRSGFGVRIPLTDGFLGFCRKERGAPNSDHILFLTGIGSILALTMRALRQAQGDMTLRQAQGDMTLRQAQGDMTLRQAQGDMTLRQAQGDMTLRQAQGDMTLRQAQGDMTLRQAQGDMTLDKLRVT